MKPHALLIDAHVHIHRCYDLATFLEGAAANFARAAARLQLPRDTPGCLMLAETATDAVFAALRDGALSPPPPWTIWRTGEAISLLAKRNGRAELIIVAGRQIATAEHLEVLALGCDQRFEDGTPIAAVVADALAGGAITVVPWGFGKWWGRRGAAVAGLLASEVAEHIFLGDNGGRPRHGGKPALFAAAERRGVRILPGTDPLPFTSQAGRAGRCGFVLSIPDHAEAPAEHIKLRLRQIDGQLQSYGYGETLPRCVVFQLGMQARALVKRFREAPRPTQWQLHGPHRP